MKPRRISLATKALVWQVAAVLAITTVVAVPRYFALRGELYEAIETSAGNLLQVLEDLVNEHPDLLQPGALDGVIDRFTRKLPAVGRVSVVTPDGRVVADSRLEVGQVIEDSAMLALLREIDREDYVDSLAGLGLSVSAGARPSHGDYQERECEVSQRKDGRRHPATNLRAGCEHRSPRKNDRISATESSPQPPRRQQEKEPQRFRCEEFEEAEDAHAARFLAEAKRFAGSDSGFSLAST